MTNNNSFMTSIVSGYLLILFILQILLLFCGVIILHFGIVLITSPDIIIGNSYKYFALQMEDYITKKLKTLMIYIIPKEFTDDISPLSPQLKFVLFSIKYLLKSCLRSVAWIGKYYVFFGLSLSINCLIGMIGFSLSNMMMILFFAMGTGLIMYFMTYFIIIFYDILKYISKQSLIELYSFFNMNLCVICTTNSLHPPLITNERYLSNLIAIGSELIQCCGIDSPQSMTRTTNFSQFPIQCCNISYDILFCILGKKEVMNPPCLPKVLSYITDNTIFGLNNFVFIVLDGILLCLFLSSLSISLHAMAKKKIYCFKFFIKKAS